ncbi:MAG: Flp family type IVb pilin [Roseiarcus sp.]|jgi:pilus assembly protein Flp/PilA
MIKSLKQFVANESGATAIEYALIASLIAVFIIGSLSALGTRLSAEFSEVSAALK